MAVQTGTGNRTSASGSTAGISVAIPANLAVGDLLVCVAHDKNGTGSTTFSAGTWATHLSITGTRRGGIYSTPITNSAALTALGSSITVTMGSGTSRRVVELVRLTGRDLTTPLDAAGAETIQGTASATLTLPAITATKTGSDIVAMGGVNVSGNTQYSGAGTNGLTSLDNPYFYDGASASTLLALYQDAATTAGQSTGTRAVTITPTPSIVVVGGMVAFAPAASSSGTGSLPASVGLTATATTTITSQVIGHRGTTSAAADTTEAQTSGLNLLPAPPTAYAVNGVEVDLQVPSDYATTGKVYLVHDTTIDRTSPNGSTGTATAMTSAQLDAAGIMDLAAYLVACQGRGYRSILLHTYDLGTGPFGAVATIINASPLKPRIVVMCNAAGSESSASAGLVNVRAVWGGRVGVFGQTAANWTFYQALFTTHNVTVGFIPPGDTAYVDNRSHVTTLKTAGVEVGGSTLNGTSIPLAISDGATYILTDVSDTGFTAYRTPVPIYAGTGTAPAAAGLSAASTTVTTGTAQLPTTVGLTATGRTITAGTGSLPATAALGAAGNTISTGTGSLPAAVGLAAQAVTVYTATGSLPTTVPLTAQAGTTTTGAGSLPTAVTLTAQAVTVYMGTGELGATVALAATSTTIHIGTGGLPAAATITATATTITTGTGNLGANAGLTGAGATSGVVTGTMPATVGLTTTDVTITTSAGTLGVGAALTADAATLTTAVGELAAAIALTAAATTIGTTTGALPVTVTITAVATTPSDTPPATGNLPLAVALTATAVTIGTVTAQLPAGVQLTATVGGQATPTGITGPRVHRVTIRTALHRTTITGPKVYE